METSPKRKNDSLLSTAYNALRILKCFSVEEPEKKVSQIAVELGLGKSTVSRLLATLAKEGFVTKDPETQKYRLGMMVLSLGGIIKTQLNLSKEARPALLNLVKEIKESAHLVILEGSDVVYTEKMESHHPITIPTHVGKKNPAFCTSSGKVLLAYQKEEIWHQIIENGLYQYTPNSITDPDKFLMELRKIKVQGYSISIEELLPDIISIAAPIYDYSEKVIAAVTIIGPVQRIHRHLIPTIRNKVVEAAKNISENLGYWR